MSEFAIDDPIEDDDFEDMTCGDCGHYEDEHSGECDVCDCEGFVQP
jgi:hypothetical protein